MRRDQHRPGYAGTWALSYILPIAAGLLLYLPTKSPVAAVTGTVAGFVLFAALAARRR